MELFAAVCVGLGLSAAGGLRLFVPLLIAGLGHRFGLVELAPALSWVSSLPSICVLVVLCIVEGTAYCIPAVDHALDVAKAPAGWIAGALISAGLLAPELHSALHSFVSTGTFGEAVYALGIGTAALSGAGVAAATQLTAAGGRVATTATTGGLGNPIYAAVESLLATAASILAVLTPIVLALLAVLGLSFAWMLIRRRAVARVTAA